MAPPQRQRFNAKARGSVAGSHKKKRRKAAENEGDVQDSNAVEIQPRSAQQKDIDRAERMRQEVSTEERLGNLLTIVYLAGGPDKLQND